MCNFFYAVSSETNRELIDNADAIKEFRDKYAKFAQTYFESPLPVNGVLKPGPNGFDRMSFITAFNQGSCGTKTIPMNDGPLGFIEYRENVYPRNPSASDFASLVRKECIRTRIPKLFGLSYEDIMLMPYDEAMKIFEDARTEAEREERQNQEMRDVMKSLEQVKQQKT